MLRPEVYAIRSFIIVLYDSHHQQLAQYQVPVSVVAPFANRLFREILNIRDWRSQSTLREPWYTLVHHYERDFQRSPLPVGSTSLYGKRYNPDSDPAPAIYMHPDALVRSFTVKLLDFQTVLYQGEYSVDDVFLHGARYLLDHRIQKGEIPAGRGPYYYTVMPSTQALHLVSADVLPEEAYQVEGVFRLPPRVKDEPRIKFTKVAEPPLPERAPATFGTVESHGKGTPQAGRVFMPDRLYAELRHSLTLSQKDEEGGYLLGNVYRLPGSAEKEDDANFRWLVEVTDLLMAENTVGTPVMLLFTGDTWSRVSRRRDREFAERKLVGWFHTHLFPASDSFGLSGLDQDMHGWYLSKPWQVAILVNLENGNERTVRCYQRGPDGDLVETPLEVF